MTARLRAICLLLALLPCLRASGQEVDPAKVAAVKAGMILNFVKYTEWPAESFDDQPSQQSRIVITLVGETDLTDTLRTAVANQVVHGRLIEVRQVSYPRARPGETPPNQETMTAFYDDLRKAEVVFVCGSERARVGTILEQLEGANVLTISDIAGFAEAGGMLGFALREKRIAFDANPDEIQQTRITVSSKVLKLARIVKTRES